MNSIYFKNFMASASMVIVSFIILGIVLVVLGRSFVINDKRDKMSDYADVVVKVSSASTQDDYIGSLEFKIFINALSMVAASHIFICDVNGVVVSCSDMDIACPHIDKMIDQHVVSALHTTGGFDQRTDLGGFYTGTYYVVAKPITNYYTNAVIGYVFIGSDSATIVDMWDTFLLVVLLTAITVLSFAITTSYFTSKRQAAPLNEMAAAARRFARGDFSARVENYDIDNEIGELTTAFNAMAESLEKSEDLRREFIANVSHELKTPTTIISGFADGLLDGTIPEEQSNKYLATISAEAKRLSRLVLRMLDLSRLQNQNKSPLRSQEFDICEVLRLALLSFEEKITAKKLDVDVNLPEESMIVRGSSDDITQVVYNLLDNAIKFSIENTSIGLSLWKQDHKAYVSVKNTGEPIADAELPLIFDRFHKTDRSRGLDREGLGLGLYLVKSILSNHDEDIVVMSRGGSTEFLFTLTLK